MQDPNALNRDKLKSLREQMAQLDRQFEEQQKQFVRSGQDGGDAGEHDREKREIAAAVVAQSARLPACPRAPAPRPARRAKAREAAGAREVFRHTVEISVKGSYFDLLDYLAALERMPQRVFWDGFELNVAQYPQAVLKLSIYTLSPEKSWLTV